MKNTPENTGRILKRIGPILSLGALAFSMALAGCITSKTTSQTITIDSEPKGVRVEANGEDLGRTPTSYAVRANSRGDFAGAFGDSPSIVFVAFPPEGADGLYKQTKVFSPSRFMEAGDRVPERIFFDMRQKSGR
jgi:hypothetical protein